MIKFPVNGKLPVLYSDVNYITLSSAPPRELEIGKTSKQFAIRFILVTN